MTSMQLILNGRVITRDKIFDNGSVLVGDGKIIAVSEGRIDAPGAAVIDAKGQYVSPGFIDIHIHGGGGHDFMDNSVEGFLEIAKTHVHHGTTAMFPTTLSCEKADLLDTLEVYEDANKLNIAGAQFMGIHLEGPYFAMSQRGAQDPRYIRNPDPEEYREILSRSKFIRRWSAAPELKGAIEFGKYMVQNGILPAIAHTDAIYEEVVEAFNSGYTLATHFYSAMSGVSRRNAYRYAGVIESAYLIDDMDVEIIADGVHLPAPLLKLIYKIKGPNRIALITDAMRAAAMPPGESILGGFKNGVKVIVEDGVAKMPDRQSFAGSVATFDLLVRNMVKLAEVPLVEAVRMASYIPARIMKIDNKKGSLEAGKDADIVFFDENINISATMINGKIIFDKNVQGI
ncbi:N-acetylglucosamine-6-phosphate deacetylase [Mucilaginibacter ginsenosidivorans]|uniref:N-acetylglucosamine-6-phosphate deacetylase n=1 Tax=Mucilaginibacter ginsenosidivorans TaxID=398053 RepID=A0A5B8V0G5_9SPHI|nr:N-acetylglucosamine-6-phosphate deacetylase [Mucilaginibacter ginsenosidivorans]QEC64742.1 N-acetylglucosamine-6-phosphate deacetylase [Mucilaginibacter ginsenosidivorans]